MKNQLALIIVCLFVLGSSRIASAKDEWTGWLGPRRNGWVSDYKPRSSWPSNLTKVWEVKVGTGYGSPLVKDGRVYQHARQDNDEVVWCFDLDTGNRIWRESFEVPFRIAGGGDYHGKGPKSSPALADGCVFTMSITGVLTARSAESGKLLWQRDYNSEFGKSHPNWGASTSPLTDGDRVIVHFGTDEEGALIALDTASGAEVWRHGKDGPSYSSPLLVEIQGVRQVVEWNHRALVGVDSNSGRFLWEYPFPHIGSDQNMPTPVFHDGRILLGGENRGIHCIEPTLTAGKWSAKDLWHQKQVALDMSSAVINGESLFGFSHYDRGRLFCLNPQTGQVNWEGPPRTGQNVMFLSMSGYVAALINNGELQILRATSERFDKVASYQVAEGRTWAPPVILTRGILVKDHEKLTLWSLTDSPSR